MLVNSQYHVEILTTSRPSENDLILMDSARYNLASEIVTLDQGWGKEMRDTKQHCIETYIPMLIETG